MTEIDGDALDPRLRKLAKKAIQAIEKGEFAYGIGVCTAVFKRHPNVWKLESGSARRRLVRQRVIRVLFAGYWDESLALLRNKGADFDEKGSDSRPSIR